MASTLSTRSRLAALSALALAALLAGCAQTATYNAAYVSKPSYAEAERLAGRVLVYTEKADDETPYVGAPTSFTGGGTKLTIPLGLIAREIAATVFGELFREGAVKSGSLEGAAQYRVVVQPKVRQFSYEYNQAKNLGFAITPTVILTLDVSLLDGAGKPLRKRSYESGTVEMPAYMISGSPGEEIGKAAHKALSDLMARAASDLREELRQPGAPGLAL